MIGSKADSVFVDYGRVITTYNCNFSQFKDGNIRHIPWRYGNTAKRMDRTNISVIISQKPKVVHVNNTVCGYGGCFTAALDLMGEDRMAVWRNSDTNELAVVDIAPPKYMPSDKYLTIQRNYLTSYLLKRLRFDSQVTNERLKTISDGRFVERFDALLDQWGYYQLGNTTVEEYTLPFPVVTKELLMCYNEKRNPFMILLED